MSIPPANKSVDESGPRVTALSDPSVGLDAPQQTNATTQQAAKTGASVAPDLPNVSPAYVQGQSSSVSATQKAGPSLLDIRAGGAVAAAGAAGAAGIGATKLEGPFAGLEPKAVWQHFQEITRIPRKSGNEGAIREHIKAFAAARGIPCEVDATGNVLLRVNPDAKGPIVGMQGHLDMVCVKDDDVRFDFAKDAIPVARDGDKLYAKGTTLGADNGIGIAYALAIAESAQGPLELLFTIDEEEGFTGIDGVQPDWLKADKMINLDSEEEGFFTIACAGGRDFVIQLDTERQPAPQDFVALEISIDGLKGGHSGDEIGKDRVNAVQVLGKILAAAQTAGGCVYGIKGGVARNAIPSAGNCTIGLPPDAVDLFKEKLAQLRDELRTDEDPDLTITSGDATPAGDALSSETVDRIVGTIAASPHGVIKATDHDPNQPYVSINLAMIEELDDGTIQISSMSRSPSQREIDAVGESVRAVAERFGGTVSEKNGFPGWEPDYDSDLLATAHAAYTEMFGKPAKTLEIHAGLECGSLKQKYPDMEVISFGPDIHDPHTPEESVSIGSVERNFALLEAIVARIHGDATAS